MDILNFLAAWWWVFGLGGVGAFMATRMWHKSLVPPPPKPGEVQAQFVLTLGCFITTLLILCYGFSILSSIVSIIGWIHNMMK